MPEKEQPLEVVLGGQKIQLEPLKAREGIELCLLLGPYLPKLMEAAKVFGGGEEADLRVELLRTLVHSMESFSGDLIRLVGLVVGRRPEWIVQNATAEELFGVLGVLTKTTEIWEIIGFGFGLGLIEEGKDIWQKAQNLSKS